MSGDPAFGLPALHRRGKFATLPDRRRETLFLTLRRKGNSLSISTGRFVGGGKAMRSGDDDAFYKERAALVDENSLDRALRYFLDRTGCAHEAGKALVQSFTVDLDVLAGLIPGAQRDPLPLPGAARAR